MKKFLLFVTCFMLLSLSAWAQNYELLFNQPYFDGGSASTSAVDSAAAIDYEIAENFSALEEDISQFVFYGLSMYHNGTAWVEVAPNATEPFVVKYYEYLEDFTTGLIAATSGVYTIELYDDFGDGWNGGLVSVYVNGAAVLEGLTLAAGAGPFTATFTVAVGDEISTVYTPGNWSSENYYRILDEAGVMIAEDGGTMADQGASAPVGIAPGGVPIVLDPAWDAPVYTINAVATSEHVGSVWTGQRQLYKYTVEFDTPIAMTNGWVSAQIDANNGSGTWFLWLNSSIGDGQSQQRVGRSMTRGRQLLSSVSADGLNRAALAYDVALELWGGELTDPPAPAANPVPADLAEEVALTASLTWTYSPDVMGYKLNFGTDNPPANIENMLDLAEVNVYVPEELEYSTQYYWQVIPYNAAGDAVGCPVWSFTTMDDPSITTFPYVEDFEGTVFPPAGWTKIVHTGNDITQSATQNHTTGGVYSTRFSSFSNSPDYNQYFFTPPITVDAAFTELSFWNRKYNTTAELLEWGIAVGTDPANYTWTPITLSNTEWLQTVVDLSAYAGQTVNFGFHYYGNYLYYVYMDDFAINAGAIQEYGTLSGTVSDVTYTNPIQGALVTLGNYSATTDIDGMYTITNILAGTYDVECSATGYNPATAEGVVIVGDQTTTQNFSLSETGAILPPTNLTAQVIDNNDVHLEWTAPGARSAAKADYDVNRAPYVSDRSGMTGIANSGKISASNTDMSVYNPRDREILYEQTLIGPDGDWSFGTSDVNYSAGILYHVDNFSGVNGAIASVTVYGLNMRYNNGWVQGTEDPMTFDVIFFADNNGQPGAEVANMSITANSVPLGVQYAGFNSSSWTLNLTTPVNLSEGWVAVAGESMGTPDCWFLWGNSLDGDGDEYTYDGTTFTANADATPDRAFLLSGETEFAGYNVYRNEALIATVSMNQTSYDDLDLAAGNYTYYVTAFYEEGESEPSNVVEVVIEAGDLEAPGNFNVTNNGYATWTAPGGGGGDLFFFDDFENGDGNWEVVNNGGDGLWMIYGEPYPNAYNMPEPSAGNVMSADSDEAGSGSTTDTELILAAPLNCAGVSAVYLEFDNSYNAISAEDFGYIYVSGNNGANWNLVMTYNATDVLNHEVIDISDYAANQSQVLVKFHSVQPGWDWWWTIDNVCITDTPTTSRELTGYNLYLDGDLVAEDVTNLFYQYDDLTEGETYTAGIRAVYDEGTSNMETFTFTYTTVELDPPTNLTAVANGSNVTLNWTAPGGGGGTVEELIYDNGTATDGYTYVGYTMATHMSPAEDCQLLTLKYFISTGAGMPFNAEVYGWAGNLPGTTLLHSVEGVLGADDSWVEVDVSDANLMMDGDFTVGFGSINADCYMGFDANDNNGRSFDFDGTSWTPWSEAYFIRAIVQYNDGRIAEISPVAVKPHTSTHQMKNAQRMTDPMWTPTNSSVVNTVSRNTRELESFKIYRDGIYLATVPANTVTYTDTNLPDDTYNYFVTALYTEGESAPSNDVDVVVDGSVVNPPTNLVVDVLTYNDVHLEWDAPARSASNVTAVSSNVSRSVYPSSDASGIDQPNKARNSIFDFAPYIPRDREVLFEQTLIGPDGDWSFGTSDVNYSDGILYHVDNFSGIQGEISSITVYGLNMRYNNGWVQGTENPMTFDVIFFADNNGQPGAEVANMSITASSVDLGVQYAGFNSSSWTLDLTSPVSLTEGWVAVAGESMGNPDCWFLWGNSLDGDGDEYTYDGTTFTASADAVPDRAFVLSGVTTFAGYNVYRNDVLIGTTGPAETSYDDLGLGAGNYVYTVTALYAQGESEGIESSVTIVLNPPQNLNGNFNNNNVVLTWTAPVLPREEAVSRTRNNSGEMDRSLMHYRIYRDGAYLNQTTGLNYVDLNIPAGVHTYYVKAMYSGNHESGQSNTYTTPTGTNDVYYVTELRGNFPNPFNPVTNISFSMEEKGNVEIVIYNVLGQKVRTLTNREFESGFQSVEWNGLDDQGKTTTSGVYFYKMITDRYTSTKKMLMLK